MSPYSDRQLREVFHLLFLERLLRQSDPKLYILKGGVNLRFFFNSPRYSEDMDIDVTGGAVTTLKKNGYKILQDPAFHRVLRTYHIAEIKINDPAKAKQTSTTQRFRLRLVNESGEAFPTKIEFSRRSTAPKTNAMAMEPIPPAVVEPYHRLSFVCQHYTATEAIRQKLKALANRSVIQARDPFDIYVIYLNGHMTQQAATPMLTPQEIELAQKNLAALTYEDYLGQVIEYLREEDRNRFKSKSEWTRICETASHLLSGL